MALNLDGKIFFKHLYGGNPDKWGIIGFPNSLSASNALRGYAKDGPVLLAVTREPLVRDQSSECLKGKIFGVATLVNKVIDSRKLANPEMISDFPEVIEIWDQAAPIKEYWHLNKPKPYSEFSEDALREIVSQRRGHLIDLTDYTDLVSEIRHWLKEVTLNNRPVYHNEETKEFLKMSSGGAE